jgi:hypothetical protein
MSDGKNIVCGKHGETPPTFVCRHVFGGVACGFHANPPAPDDPWPDAWCDLCEEAFQAGGGEWNEESEKLADIKMLCTHCYADARARNHDVPRLARGAAARLTEREAADLLHHAVHEGQALQTASNKRLGWLDMPRWDYDGDSSTLTFSAGDDKLIADVRLVGSLSTKSNTFQWAWKTLDVGSSKARDVSYVRVFGEVRGIELLTTANFTCDQATGWKMAAIAAYLLGAEGLYRPPMQHAFWFMLLSNFRKPN